MLCYTLDMAYQNKVTSITIKGFKSIKSLENFKLNNLNVMIGQNGAGKSNFIGLFKLLNEIVETRLQSYIQRVGGAEKILYFGSKTTQSLEVNIDFGPNSYWLKLAPTTDDQLYFETEGCSYQGPYYSRPYTIDITSSDKRETGLKDTPGNIAATVRESILSWKLYHFHDTSDTSPMKKKGTIDDNSKLRPDASNLAPYLYLLQQNFNNDFANITDTIRIIAPFFQKFILRPSELNKETIQLEWQHVNSESYFNAASLSDGTLRFIALATLLLQPADRLPKTILLDEPELGLHPAAISLLAHILKGTSQKTQIIVSTQSVSLINQLEPDSIIVVDRNMEQSTLRRLNKEELDAWIEDYGLGDMWEKNILGGRP